MIKITQLKLPVGHKQEELEKKVCKLLQIPPTKLYRIDLDNPYQCPHGRPTIISMSKYEIEKKFKRIV